MRVSFDFCVSALLIFLQSGRQSTILKSRTELGTSKGEFGEQSAPTPSRYYKRLSFKRQEGHPLSNSIGNGGRK